MADFTITTTADFDAGLKSDSLGNYEIETVTDNPTTTANQIELANKKGDNFTFDDADTETWKWTITTPGGTKDISSNRLNFDLTRSGTDVNWISKLTTNLSGDFDIIMKIDWSTAPTANNAYTGYRFWANSTNWVYVLCGYYNSVRKIQVYSRVANSNVINAVVTSDDSIQIRIRRTGTTFYCDYDLAQSESWTNLQTRGSFFTASGQLELVTSTLTANQGHVGYLSNFKMPTSTFVDATGYRTSGNWRGASQTMTAGKKLNDITITHSGLDGSNYIDKVEILDASDNAILSTYDTNITTGASTNLVSGDFDNGFDSTADTNFKVKTYYVGDGTVIPVITQIEGNYIVTVAYPRFDGQTWGSDTKVRFDSETF